MHVIFRRANNCAAATVAAALLVVVLIQPALSTPPTAKIRLGYLHTLAVDGHLWLGVARGIWRKYGLDFEPVRFTTGIALAQAMAGGSIDLGIMGAVISNFPSRGVGKIVLLNNIEHQTAVIFAQPDSGILKVADLRGRKLSTTRGTTADVLLFIALRKAGIDYNSVQVINMDMASAVGAFITGAVDAVSTWWPFDLHILKARPSAHRVTHAGNYFPEAAIAGGWVTSNGFYASNRPVLVRLVQAWLEINHLLLNDVGSSLRTIHEVAYPELSYDDIRDGYTKIKYFQNGQWAEMYRSGQAARWVGQVQQVFISLGAFRDFVPPERFFDTSIFLEAFRVRTSR